MNVSMSKLGLGCWSFGSDRYWGEQSHTDSVKTIQAALRGGVTHFDTAQVYASGRSEQITGQQLKRVRDKVIIATKSMYHSPKTFQKGIDTSLRRLCTDYIDIFYLHWPSPGKNFIPVMQTLEKNRRQGKIHSIGVSNFSPSGIKLLMEWGNIDYCQTGYSLLWRKSERKVIPFCIKNGIKIISYSSLAQGVLTDKFLINNGFRADDARNNLIFFTSSGKSLILEALHKFQSLARDNGMSLAQLSLLWVISQPWIHSVLAGARTRSQVEENINTLSFSLSPDLNNTLTDISGTLAQNLSDADNIFNHTPR